jgi:probable HAF family extracellular repeat protein
LGGASEARGINNHNEVVGWAYGPGAQMRAFVWSEGDGMLDLNSLIDPSSGWQLWAAMAINDAGQIVGTGWFNGKDTAFRLDPIPEPATWRLLGLGGLAIVTVRRRSRR